MKENKKNNADFNNSSKKIELAIEVMVKEFEVLRKEIDVYHNYQEKIMMYSLITMGALFGSLVYIKENNLSNVLLLFPLLFTVYGYLFADKTVRILRLADYLHNGLRPKLCEKLEENLLQWEIYKREYPLFPSDKSLYLDITRWGVFIIPGVISLGLYYSYFGGKLEQMLDIFLFIFDIFILFLLAIYIYNINETKGIKSRSDVDLDLVDPVIKKQT